MTKTLWPVVLLVVLCACHKPTPEEKAAAAFTISPLQPGDGADLTGCITKIARAGPSPSYILIEDSLQGGAMGYIRINGRLTKITMTSGGSDSIHSVRSFVDGTNALSVVESYDIKDAAPGQTVRPLTGQLIVTWKGGTQTIAIGGARNCIDAP
ncbi:hypothetical protein [Asticcacaulis taihuensis]|uniref:hypothetical protein n=1 Tax=Asticcacaulis taihuensis TaxID=260084 RepID=UPI003F7B3A01